MLAGDRLLARGVVGLANDGASLPGAAATTSSGSYDYDCMAASTKRAVAHVFPIANLPDGVPRVAGVATFVQLADGSLTTR